VALSELYTWTTTGLAACFPSIMVCLLARQEGSKRKTTITATTLLFVAAPPKDVVKPEAVRIYPNVDRI
jgi:hypothetical protein